MKKYIVILIAGMLIGGFLTDFLTDLLTPKPETKTATEPIIKENIDTSFVTREVDTKSQAEITNVSIGGDSSQSFEKVAKWDTTTVDGFEAHIKYFTQQEVFQNRFKIPERTITKFKTIETTSTITNTVFKLPQWELGIGAKALYSENKFNYYPMLTLTYNAELWIVNASIEGKAITSFNSGSISMEPEIEVKLKFNL